jgi:hypothetical protein
MTTWIPVETLERTFRMLAVVASGQEVKLLVMGQVSTLCLTVEYHYQVVSISDSYSGGSAFYLQPEGQAS